MMDETRDPERLADGSTPEADALRLLLDAAADDVPSAAERARLDANVAALTETGAAIGAGLSKAALVKWVVVASVGAAVIGGAVQLGENEQTAREAPPAAGDRAAEVRLLPPRERHAPEPRVQRSAPRAAPAAPPPPPVEVPEPARRARRARRAEIEVAPPPSAEPEPPALVADPREDLALLSRARRALRAQRAAEALELSEEHARRFAASSFAQEREALAVEALAGLGRTSEARGRLERFVARYPESTYRARLRAIVLGAEE